MLGLAVTLAWAAAPRARAVPLVPAGDAAVRRDMELLRDAGMIPGPLAAWPVSWEQAADSSGANEPAWAASARRRILRLRPETGSWLLQSSGGIATDPALVYGFDGGPRRRVDLRVAVERTWNRTTARLALGYRAGGDGPEQVVWDGSHVTQGFGNWVAYGGAVERWYGPGYDAGMVLGRNARPVPGVGVFRNVPRRSHHVFLRWMGPWRVDAFLGVLNGGRSDAEDPLYLNLHWSLEPVRRLELAFTRGIVICGEGRPCSPGIWLRSLVGVFDLDNAGHEEDASNQTASIAASYAVPVGGAFVTPYFEIYIEDEIKFFSPLAGGRATGSLGGGRLWHARVEYSDTYANRAFGDRDSGWFPVRPGVTYGHAVYRDGYTYRGDWLGHPLGGDGRLFTVEAGVVWPAGWSLGARARLAEVRVNPLSPGDAEIEAFHVAEILGTAPVAGQHLGARVRLTDRDPLEGASGSHWEAELSYRVSLGRGVGRH